MRVEDFVAHDNGITVSARGRGGIWHEHGDAVIAADGLWSVMRARMGYREPPRFAGRTAWRALVPAEQAPPNFRAPLIHLWLGREAHIVHYPVKDGALINIVVIINDGWNAPGWSAPAQRDELLPRLSVERVAPQVLGLINQPEAWLKWALFDRRPLLNWSQGAVALIGDAAHPMLPYLAQGAAMAIEDAAVAAQCLAQMPDDATEALRAYCAVRRARAWKVQRLAARNGQPLSLRRHQRRRAQHGDAASWAERGCYIITIGSMIGARPQRYRSALMLFPTTIAGSLPKPAWLAEPNKLWAPWRLQGEELATAKETPR